MKTAHTAAVRLASRLDRSTLLLGLLVAAAMAFVSYFSVIAINGVPFRDRYQVKAVITSEARPLKDGDEVRIAGQSVGQVTDVRPARTGALVEMQIDPEQAPIGRDASVRVRLKSLSYLFYLEIEPGDRSDPLPEGGTIPSERTSAGEELLEAVEDFDSGTRRAQRRTLSVNGLGLIGRGAELNAALQDLPVALRQATPELRAFSPRRGDFAGFLEGARKTARGFQGEQPDDVRRIVPATRATLEAFANRSHELGAMYDLLRPFEDEARATLPLADPLLDETSRMAEELTPGIEALDAATPNLNRLLRQGDELRASSRRLTAATDPVLRTGTPLMRELYPTAASLAPLATPLTPFSAFLSRYDREIFDAGQGLTAVSSRFYEEGATAPNNPVLRFSGVFTCHNPRDPYPEPGEVYTHSESCQTDAADGGSGGGGDR